MTGGFDPRVTPARADLAADFLQGKFAAPIYASGRMMRATTLTPLRSAPDGMSALNSEILPGEIFTLYEEKDGWLWGQATLDNYVGYVPAVSFALPGAPPNHRVVAPSTLLLTGPDVKFPSQGSVPLNSKLVIMDEEGRFSRLTSGAFVFSGHLAPLNHIQPDWVGVAEKFLNTPYLWGGKTIFGVDCSGLIQLALEAANIASPRDSDMMQVSLGASVPFDLAHLKRGDVVFWPGHVGVMTDATELLHANTFHMAVAREPLTQAVKRIAATGLAVCAVKRL